MSPQELREDIYVLNVVNFGGGTYVIYAEILPSGEIEVDPEPYSDTFDRPGAAAADRGQGARRRHRPDRRPPASRRSTPRARRSSTALGDDPVEEGLQITSPTAADDVAHTVERAVHEQPAARPRLLVDDRGRASRSARVEPYALINGREGWYVAAFDPAKDGMHHFRLDRIKARRRRSTSTSSRGPSWTRSPTSRAGRAPATVARLARRPRVDLPRAGALGARGAHRPRRARGRLDHRRVDVQGRGLPRQGDPQGGRATRSCSSPPTPARRSSPPPSGCSPRAREPPRADRHDGRGGRRVPRRAAHRDLRDARAATAGRT